ncbi:MAG TPA: hypothetical protein VK879_06925, partial [Candidatus Sulfomarinibacteraceae bacterium]|nr:hypothetical protein [Candidatus Sulfomarinibacteraceae bacterium]
MNRVLSSSRLPRRVAAALAALEPLLLLLLAPLFLFPPTWIHLLAPLLLLPWFGRVLAYGRLTYRSLLNAPTFLILLLGILAYTVSVDRAVSHPILWGIVFQTALFFVVLNLLDTTQRLRRAYWLLLAMPPAVALFALFGVDWSLVRLLP